MAPIESKAISCALSDGSSLNKIEEEEEEEKKASRWFVSLYKMDGSGGGNIQKRGEINGAKSVLFVSVSGEKRLEMNMKGENKIQETYKHTHTKKNNNES